MATLNSAILHARSQTQSDSNGLTDTNAIIWANARLVDFHRQLVLHGVDASQIQETYCNGVIPATAGNGSTLTYPTDCLALKTIEINYADTQAANYIRAEQVDAANLPNQTSFSWLRQNASTLAPKFDDRGDWYEVFPTFISGNNTSQAIRLFYYLKPTEYTATSDTIAYPESQDYRILGWGIAADYLTSIMKIQEAEAFEKKYQARVSQYVTTLGRGSQQPIQATAIQITGWEY